MAFASTSPSSSLLRSSISSHQLQVTRAVPWMHFGGSNDHSLVPPVSGNCTNQRQCLVKPIFAESKRSQSLASLLKAEVEDNVEAEDYEELAKQLENASPLAIMDKALEKFGNEIAIAFSGAEDVALIEYAKLTGRPFRVFSLDTGRLNPETYQFFDTVEKHYGIHIEYMFPDAVEVQAFVRGKGLFSFYEDGHQECCKVRKVRPLRRALKGLRSWITGQRKDQSPGTRAEIPVVQVDPSFEGKDGGVGSLVKWNPLANIEGNDIWNFLLALNVPVNSLHSQGYVSIGCEPCTRPVMPGQHEREGRWWWEDSKAKECGLHKGNIKHEEVAQLDGNGNSNGNVISTTNGNVTVDDIFNSQNLIALSRTGIENLARLENRSEPWIVVLYAPWCRFCQAMEASYAELAEELAGLGVKVAKFRADGDQKAYAQQELQLGSFPTILFFPKHSSQAIKYPSEKRDLSSLMVFVNALRVSTPEQYVRSMVNSLGQQIERLYSNHAREFVIVGVGAIGSTPSERVKSKSQECNLELNNWSHMYHHALSSMLNGLKSKLKNFNYSYFDPHSAAQNIIKRPPAFGFAEVKAACCGLGVLNAQVPCLPITKYCSNRNEFVFWDADHPTEALHRLLVDNMYNKTSKYTFPTSALKPLHV
ncbi:hypothetical protein FNV43_RR03887 [Rhamnella rubrinervis]|uniref:adenylyl-sulfate reductase (glutathione) n=1 Tax=Rhamnella rubrinervis TaxID=2594499 RepID=A0A8K0HIS6_9ROSA|nr:hypothetical protein FNV43_RR03887 [Rhamnella rubrinervis]